MKGRVADFWRCGEKERKEWGRAKLLHPTDIRDTITKESML
jgi:hypothetical protein